MCRILEEVRLIFRQASAWVAEAAVVLWRSR